MRYPNDPEKRKIWKDDYNKKHYKKNKQYYKDKAKRHKMKIRKWYIDLKKSKKCIECSESDFRCLDFHHRDPERKEFNISDISRVSRKRALKEIEKCNPLCKNCHAKLTFYKDYGHIA